MKKLLMTIVNYIAFLTTPLWLGFVFLCTMVYSAMADKYDRQRLLDQLHSDKFFMNN